MKCCGIVGGEGESLRNIHLHQIFVEFSLKSGSVETESLSVKVNSYARRILSCLNTHIFIRAHFGKLRPERDIQAQGKLQCPVNAPIRHYSHSCSAASCLKYYHEFLVSFPTNSS